MVLGFDPVNAFNYILERLDNIIVQLTRIADAVEKMAKPEKKVD
jgi:hypothetical protein